MKSNIKYTLSYYLLLGLSIVTLAWLLPHFYTLMFQEQTRPRFVTYSAVSKDFYSFKVGTSGLIDRAGNEYTEHQADSLLPFFYYRQLYSQGKMPDSVQNIAITPELFQRENYMLRIKSDDTESLDIGLYPLFESNPLRGKLQMPKDVFRITERMEFLDCESNQINEEKSVQFTTALQKLNFEFPAKKVFGNPTTRKAYDLGYFVIDNADKLFHIMMKDGKEIVKAIAKDTNLDIARFMVTEHTHEDYYAFVIDTEGNLYYLTRPEYTWKKLPIPSINVTTDNMTVIGNPLYHLVRVYNDHEQHSYALTKPLVLENSYSKTLQSWKESTTGKLTQYLFPFELSLHKEGSNFIHFHLTNFSYYAFMLNVIMALLSVVYFRKQGKKDHLPQTLICLLTGIYGFIAVLIFRK